MANRDPDPASSREQYDKGFEAAEHQKLFDLILELKTQLDNLRRDVLNHDHGAAYGASTNGGATGIRRHASAVADPAALGSIATTVAAPKKH